MGDEYVRVRMDRPPATLDAPGGDGADAGHRVDRHRATRHRVDRAVPAGLAVVAAALVLLATRDGMGTTPDGVSYLGAAANLADGRGLTGPFTTMVDPFHPAQAVAFDGRVPFIQWPPLYPLVLGLAAAAGLEAEVTARLVSALCLAATVGGTGWIVGRLAPRAWAAAAAAGLWVLLSPHAALLHVLVASEHLFLALALGSLWSASRWLADHPWRDGASWPWAVVAVGLATAATLTRYVGAAVVVALAVGVLVVGAGSWWRRVGRAAAVAAVGLVPALVWSQVTARQAGVATRTVAWHPPDRVQWESVVDTVVGWLVPADAATGWRVLVVAVAVGVLLVAGWGWATAVRRGAPPEARPWLVLAVTFVVGYLAVVVATHSLLDRAVPVGQRLLLPVQPPVAVTVAVGLAWAWRATAPGWAPASRRLAAAGAVVLAVAVAVPLRSTWWPLVEPGRPWPADPATTPTGRYLADVADDAVLASNDPALAWHSSGRTTIALPVRTSAPTGLDNPAFADDLDELADVLAERDGVAVVYTTSAFLNPHVASVVDLESAGFEVVATFEDAVVLAPPSAAVG